MNATLPICTVGYLLRTMNGSEEIHLGEKAATDKAVKRKIAGKLIGYGGDFEPDKDLSIKESFARELSEESGFSAMPHMLDVAAKVLVRHEKGDRLTLYYVLARHWSGSAGESREFARSGWFPTKRLPDNVLGADKIILPRILAGLKLEGWVEYDKDMNVVAHELKEVASVS